MSRTARCILFFASGFALAVLLLLGLRGLPGFGRYPGPYGDRVAAMVVQERHVTNTPTAINFDYRGLDTLGEEFILFASVAALALLLRTEREKSDRKEEPPGVGHLTLPPDEAVQWSGLFVAVVLVVFGIYVVLHGPLTPGGGFHGGVIAASGSLLIYLASGAAGFHACHPKAGLDALDGIGAGAYALTGIVTVLAGGTFLVNILPLGKVGAISSGGTIALLNFAVGVEVFAAFVLLFSEFIKERRSESEGGS